MVLKFLERLGRKKLVYDRGPSHPEYINAKPWMNRYYLLFRHRPKWFPFKSVINHHQISVSLQKQSKYQFSYIKLISKLRKTYLIQKNIT